jgi:ATP-dependent Clp protease ATP-binding subunit ClpB
VVLLDEIEKAHPEVFNLFLQILDEGRVTDSHGRVINFRNTVIIMTSNIPVDPSRDLVSQLKQFRPEFLNRIDEIIYFRSLEMADLQRIVEIQTARLNARLADRGLQVRLTESALKRLAIDGFDPVFGARPLKRVIQRQIQDRLAMELLKGGFKEGDSIEIDWAQDGGYTFEKASATKSKARKS